MESKEKNRKVPSENKQDLADQILKDLVHLQQNDTDPFGSYNGY